MIAVPWLVLLLALVAAAAVANGALGYGFSSLVVPIAVLWVASRLLNPAVVLVELGVNLALVVRERRFVGATWPRVRPMVVGLVPGVLLGTLLLASVAPMWVRLSLYAILLPLVLLQLVGVRRVVLNERPVGAALGAGIGTLYSLTTISGPPLALFWRNQGMAKGEFRCALAQVRLAEGSMTALAYVAFGLFTPSALGLVPWMVVPVLVGVPLGAWILAGFTRDFFSRVVMSADGVVVLYGMLSVLTVLQWIPAEVAWALFALGAAGVAAITYRVLRRIPFVRSRPNVPDRSFGWDTGL